MAKCNRDCFNCKYEDCIIEKASSEERKEIRERDNRYFKTNVMTGSVIRGATKHRHHRENYGRTIYV